MRPSVRSLLVLVALLPLLGLGVETAISASERWSDRDAARLLSDQTEQLDRLVADRTALTTEQTVSITLVLAQLFGVDVDEFEATTDIDLTGRLATARAAVDDIEMADGDAALADARDDVERVRRLVEEGRADFDDVYGGFDALGGLLDDAIAEGLERITTTGADSRLPAGITDRVDALEASLAAFAQLDPISSNATQIFLGVEVDPALVTPEAVTDLVEALARFETAIDAATTDPSLPAADAWRAFRRDPSAQRTQANYEFALRLGLGVVEPLPLDSDGLRADFDDAQRWTRLIEQALVAASEDLRDEARAQVREETESMVLHIGRTALLTVIALAVALIIARQVTRPIERIATAASHVREGHLDVGRLETTGPRELASTARAFNDMVGTLSAVERGAIALAEAPDDPSLDEPLPGPMGRALQGAIDRLRVSIRLAEERRAELHRVAAHDGLTGLLNRTAALDAIGRELAQARRDDGLRFAFFIDLDNLKEINDTHGHDAGDDAIRLTAEAMRSETREADVVSRLGGDEFLVAGRTSGGRDAIEDQARRIVAAVGAQTVRVVDGEIPVRCSLGIATTEPGPDEWSVEELVQAADDAMYDAKQAGGNTVRWAEPAAGTTTP